MLEVVSGWAKGDYVCEAYACLFCPYISHLVPSAARERIAEIDCVNCSGITSRRMRVSSAPAIPQKGIPLVCSSDSPHASPTMTRRGVREPAHPAKGGLI